MPETNAKGLMKIGDYIDWDKDKSFGANGEYIPVSRFSLIKIVDMGNEKDVTENLKHNQLAISGANLLDDKRMTGHVESDKIYIFEE